ncbi:MAG TPA: restriction endonuclease [Firmicutes bacterium]|nr:restriction endonuclease [Bacillota bacterium]
MDLIETDARLFHRFLDRESRETAELLSRHGVLDITELRTGLKVQANSHVGKIQLNGLQFTVYPKIQGFPLYRLLKYAYGIRELRLYDRAIYDLDESPFQDLLIHHLCAEAEELIARGLDKRYRKEEAELELVRGRISINRVAAKSEFSRPTLPCRYFARTEDSVLNRVLLSGLILAVNIADDHMLKARLRRLIQTLEATISPVELSKDLLIRVSRSLDRLNEHYRPALELINILLSSYGLFAGKGRSHKRLYSFFFDMNVFFQALLSRLLNDYLEGYAVRNEYVLYDMFAYEPGHNPLGNTPPRPRPDFAVIRKRKVVCLLDAKYRDLWEHGLPSSWLYQLAIYAASGVGEGAAKILYPTTSERAKLQVLKVRNPATGKAFCRVLLQPVSLIKVAQLLDLAEQGKRSLKKYIEETVFEGIR